MSNAVLLLTVARVCSGKEAVEAAAHHFTFTLSVRASARRLSRWGGEASRGAVAAASRGAYNSRAARRSGRLRRADALARARRRIDGGRGRGGAAMGANEGLARLQGGRPHARPRLLRPLHGGRPPPARDPDHQSAHARADRPRAGRGGPGCRLRAGHRLARDGGGRGASPAGSLASIPARR